MRHLSAESTLALSASVLTLCLAAVGAGLVGWQFEAQVEQVGERVLRGAVEAFSTQQQGEIEKLGATLDALMASDELRAAFKARDRAQLLAHAEPVFHTLRDHDRISHWYFHEPDPSRRVFLRVHKPELFGDRVERATLERAVETGDLGAGLELGRTAFALRVVRPWFEDGQVIGYMELAEEIDHFLEAMKRRSGDDYGLLVKKRFIDEKAWAAVLGPLANSWNGRADMLAVDGTAAAEGMLDYMGDLDSLGPRGDMLGEVVVAGRAYIRGVFPVSDAAGRQVGGLFVAHDFTAHHAAVQDARRIAFAFLLGLAALACAAHVVLARVLVFRRVHLLRERLERRASGWDPAGNPGAMQGHDDLARLEALFGRALSAEAEGTGGREPRPPAPAAPPPGP